MREAVQLAHKAADDAENRRRQAALAEAPCSEIPAHELEHLADTWRNQAKDYCGQGMGIALESCALDLSRLVSAYSPNDQAHRQPPAAKVERRKNV